MAGWNGWERNGKERSGTDRDLEEELSNQGVVYKTNQKNYNLFYILIDY